jgi:hypothetical protein
MFEQSVFQKMENRSIEKKLSIRSSSPVCLCFRGAATISCSTFTENSWKMSVSFVRQIQSQRRLEQILKSSLEKNDYHEEPRTAAFPEHHFSSMGSATQNLTMSHVTSRHKSLRKSPQ